MGLKRMLIAGGFGLASMAVAIGFVPGVAGADQTNCYTTVQCNTPSNPPPSPPPYDPYHTLPYTSSSGGAATTPASAQSTLPFTGADVEELAAIGAGAVLVGGALAWRRRRRTAA